MKTLIFFIFLIIFVCVVHHFVSFRILLCHIFSSLIYGLVDSFLFFYNRTFKICKTGYIYCFSGLFGSGKTLSAVHMIRHIYEHYNNTYFFDSSTHKKIHQRVLIVSNVTLNIPYMEFTSLEQIVKLANFYDEFDTKNDTLTNILVLGDEFSVQLNSRNFKKNIDPLFLNTLLTCRHHHIALIYTAQRFNQVDALLRQVTTYTIQCSKHWRFLVHDYFNSWTLENASDPSVIRPVFRTGFFVKNSDFDAYDTIACVKNFEKSAENGDFLKPEEILQSRAQLSSGTIAPDEKLQRKLLFKKPRKRKF